MARTMIKAGCFKDTPTTATTFISQGRAPGKAFLRSVTFLMACALLFLPCIAVAQPSAATCEETQVPPPLKDVMYRFEGFWGAVNRAQTAIELGQTAKDLKPSQKTIVVTFLWHLLEDHTQLEWQRSYWDGRLAFTRPTKGTTPSKEAQTALSAIEPQWRDRWTHESIVDNMVLYVKCGDKTMRLMAALSLRWMWTFRYKVDLRALGPLIEALKDEDAKVVAAAYKALTRVRQADGAGLLIAALDDDEQYSKRSVIELLSAMKDPSTTLLIPALKDSRPRVRAAVAEALGSIRDRDRKSADPLFAACSDPDQRVREAALNSLGKMNDPRTLGLASTDAKSEDPKVRAAAARALSMVTDPGKVDVLLPMTRDGDLKVRKEATLALTGTKDPRVVEPLLVALKDKTLRSEAIGALAHTGDPRVVEPLMEMLRDEDPAIRGHAARLFSTVKDRRALPVLRALLKNSDQSMRTWLMDAIRAIEFQ
jgi:HEAT repeat protein